MLSFVRSSGYGFLICAAGIVTLAAAPVPQGGSGYHLLKKVTLGGEGGWDYLSVDNAARRLYVSHGTQVEVLDVDSGAIVGKIPNTQGVHGIAIAPDAGRGFTSNGTTATVTISSNVSGTVTASGPSNLLITPASQAITAGGSVNFSIISLNNTRGTFAVNFGSACTTVTLALKVTN